MRCSYFIGTHIGEAHMLNDGESSSQHEVCDRRRNQRAFFHSRKNTRNAGRRISRDDANTQISYRRKTLRRRSSSATDDLSLSKRPSLKCDVRWRIRSMARKRHTTEQIVAKFRQADVVIAQYQQVADAIRAIGVAKATGYRWRNE